MNKIEKFVEGNDLKKSAPLCALFYWYYCTRMKAPSVLRQWWYLRKFKKLCSDEEREFWILFFYEEELVKVMRGLRNLDENWKEDDELYERLDALAEKFGEDWKIVGIVS